MNQTPKLYIGPPGVGKTAHIVAQYGYTEIVLLSSATEEDFAGLPWRDGVYEKRTMPGVFQRLNEESARHERVCLFLDELDKSRQEVADTLLTLIVSRRLGEWSLPANCDIVAAANPPEWGGGKGISRAMQTRFAVIRYKPNIDKWVAWLLKTYPGDLSERIAKGVRTNQVPLFEHTGDGYEFRLTCPRTWELAIRAMLFEGDYEETVSGLLTPNAADYLLRPQKSEGGGIQDLARSVAQRAMGTSNKKGVKNVSPLGSRSSSGV